jgi:O-acetyl-ADP-ribose deacetylase (regulator of RNase III)
MEKKSSHKNIVYKKGDVLMATTDIIVHQVNCRGVMGAGLAKQIKEKYPHVFTEYKNHIAKIFERERGIQGFVASTLLGTISTTEISLDNSSQVIVNLFAQDDHDSTTQQTNYKAFYSCLLELKNWALRKYGLCSIAFPYKIGCGLAGGDWDIIRSMIEEVFYESLGIDIEIWEFCK